MERLYAFLDYSKGSLDLLENFIQLHYKNILDTEKPGEGFILDKLSRYVGETYRKALGAKWQIQLDDPHYAYYGIPELTSSSPLSTPICPMTLVTASVDRRTGTYLRTVLENILQTWKHMNEHQTNSHRGRKKAVVYHTDRMSLLEVYELHQEGVDLLCQACGAVLIVALTLEEANEKRTHPGIFCPVDLKHLWSILSLVDTPRQMWEQFEQGE